MPAAHAVHVSPFGPVYPALHWHTLLLTAPVAVCVEKLGQGLHVAAPTWSWYLAAGQKSHSPGGPKVPAGQEHEVTEVEPSGDPDDAAGQSWHTSDVAAMEDENLPPAQRVHALDPVSASNVPAGHSVQDPIPFVPLYLPVSHAVHPSVPPA